MVTSSETLRSLQACDICGRSGHASSRCPRMAKIQSADPSAMVDAVRCATLPNHAKPSVDLVDEVRCAELSLDLLPSA